MDSAVLTDKEIVRACAEALGLTIDEQLHSAEGCIIKAEDRYYEFNPLVSGNHTFKLIKKFHMMLGYDDERGWTAVPDTDEAHKFDFDDIVGVDQDPQRAVCLSAANYWRKLNENKSPLP